MIKNKIREMRLRLGLNQTEVASFCETSTAVISLIESGQVLPTPEKMEKLTSLLKCHTYDLYAHHDIRLAPSLNDDENTIVFRLKDGDAAKMAEEIELCGFESVDEWFRFVRTELRLISRCTSSRSYETILTQNEGE